jgi:hypothetical protein
VEFPDHGVGAGLLLSSHLPDLPKIHAPASCPNVRFVRASLRPIGFLQIIDPAREDSHYWGEIEENLRAIDIWIGGTTALDRGFGTRMMRFGRDDCIVYRLDRSTWGRQDRKESRYE